MSPTSVLVSASPDFAEANSFTALTVASGPPACRSKTFPFLSMPKTPLVVPLGVFLNPMAPINEALLSQRRG